MDEQKDEGMEEEEEEEELGKFLHQPEWLSFSIIVQTKN